MWAMSESGETPHPRELKVSDMQEPSPNWEATEEIATDIATDISGLKHFLDMAIFNGFRSYGDEEYKELEKNYGNIVNELKHTEYLQRYEKASYEDKITWLVEYYGQVRVMYNVKHVVTGKCISIK